MQPIIGNRVLADASNFDTGLPSLTTSLRGNIVIEVVLKALKAPLHSGMWGGPVPDAVHALCRMVASLSDATGRILVPGIYEHVRPLSAQEEALYRRLPYSPEKFAERDRMWADGDPAYYALSDALQHLGNVAFRAPVPAYKHSAAVFLNLVGRIPSSRTHPRSPLRPAWEGELLWDCATRLGW